MPDTIHGSEHRRLVGLLRAARRRAGLRQVDVAARLGMPQSFVSKYETGERRLDFVEVKRVCDTIGITLLSLVRDFEAGK